MRAPGFEGLRRRLPVLVTAFCLAQPLLDVAGYWQSALGVSNALTMGLRMLLLGVCALGGFCLSNRKGWYFLLAGVLILVTGGHVLACLRSPQGYPGAVTDLVNLVRIYFLPITTLCFLTFLEANEKVYPALWRALVWNLGIIGLVQLLSTLTGTDPHTYAVPQIGVLGWFLWTNSQSGILSMLLPLALGWAVRRWPDRVWSLVPLTLAGEATLFFFGTRLSFACMAAGGGVFALALLVLDRRHWKQGLAIFLTTLALVGCYPLSPLHSRQANNEKIIEKNEAIRDALEIPENTLSPESLSQDPELYDKAFRFYRAYQKGLVQRFGFDRMAAKYGYTLDQTVLGDNRLGKRVYCDLLMEDSGPLARVFGLDLEQMRIYVPLGVRNPDTDKMEDGWVNYDVENDFHGIYYLTGLVGLGLMLAFLLTVGLRALIWALGDLRTRLSPELAAFGLAYGFAMVHAVFTASVLRRTNASVYFALVLACLWYLPRRGGPAVQDRKEKTL